MQILYGEQLTEKGVILELGSGVAKVSVIKSRWNNYFYNKGLRQVPMQVNVLKSFKNDAI